MDAHKAKKINRQDRDWYVEFWANYVRTHKDREWGRQQNAFINSLMHGARQSKISAADYMKIKGEKRR